MRRFFRPAYAVLLLFLSFYYSSCYVYAKKDDAKPVREFLEKVEKMRIELLNAKNDAAKEKILRRARKFALKMLDIHEIARLSLGRFYIQFTKEQKEDFFEYFEELMAHQVVMAHVPPGAVTSTNTHIELVEEIRIRDKVFRKNAFVVRTRFPHEQVYYNIDFYLHRKKNEFKLYDIHVDGASILLDYRKQFYSIIERKGIDYLIERIKEKVDSINNGRTLL